MQGAFNIATFGWVPCGVLILFLAAFMRRDEDAMQRRLAAASEAATAAAEAAGAEAGGRGGGIELATPPLSDGGAGPGGVAGGGSGAEAAAAAAAARRRERQLARERLLPAGPASDAVLLDAPAATPLPPWPDLAAPGTATAAAAGAMMGLSRPGSAQEAAPRLPMSTSAIEPAAPVPQWTPAALAAATPPPPDAWVAGRRDPAGSSSGGGGSAHAPYAYTHSHTAPPLPPLRPVGMPGGAPVAAMGADAGAWVHHGGG
ncbi:hypothetical protein GPECTOR_30g138 [Gonium pectorale]|uniref:Uncharacterized protein n=1 Tax=Gonium pectorale TaxID=33097 RepID=A0A150GE42_GONPE|nr:hypothetical protein GPECTOR_30g138 [Gonium pectorale]|eukprot:KXZ48043.1 hypothetical protein GPECTOR_30g138 [Gonium pectorale]